MCKGPFFLSQMYTAFVYSYYMFCWFTLNIFKCILLQFIRFIKLILEYCIIIYNLITSYNLSFSFNALVISDTMENL